MKKAITFFISQAITLFGSQIVAFAIIWYITIETSSGLWVALLTICSFVPQFLCSFIGGHLLTASQGNHLLSELMQLSLSSPSPLF